MHDFFYQPMLYDLLDIKNNIAEYEDEDKNGKTIIKKSVLTENDDLFEKYRYRHIAEALDGIPADFQVFMNNNANAKLNKGEIDLSEMSEIVKKMPQYNELMKKYTLHMKLIEKAWAVLALTLLKEKNIFRSLRKEILKKWEN
jgi:syntaxin-binding protein 1